MLFVRDSAKGSRPLLHKLMVKADAKEKWPHKKSGCKEDSGPLRLESLCGQFSTVACFCLSQT